MIHKPSKEIGFPPYWETCALCGAKRTLLTGGRNTPWMLLGQRQRYCMGGKT